MEEREINKNESPCCSPNASCCGSADTDIKNDTIDADIKEKLDPNKLNVDIYVPLDACACEWSQFMNLIFSALTPYIKHIKYETKNLNSEEARNLGLSGKCVLVDGKKKYTTSYALKKDLPDLLEQKDLT